jgi:hypothetical protein
MKYATDRPYADPENKLLDIANAVEKGPLSVHWLFRP